MRNVVATQCGALWPDIFVLHTAPCFGGSRKTRELTLSTTYIYTGAWGAAFATIPVPSASDCFSSDSLHAKDKG